jgi:hypothetical protein
MPCSFRWLAAWWWNTPRVQSWHVPATSRWHQQCLLLHRHNFWDTRLWTGNGERPEQRGLEANVVSQLPVFVTPSTSWICWLATANTWYWFFKFSPVSSLFFFSFLFSSPCPPLFVRISMHYRHMKTMKSSISETIRSSWSVVWGSRRPRTAKW